MKPLRSLKVAFRVATVLFLLAWLPALAGCRTARVLFVSSWPVVAGLALFLAFRRSP